MKMQTNQNPPAHLGIKPDTLLLTYDPNNSTDNQPEVNDKVIYSNLFPMDYPYRLRIARENGPNDENGVYTIERLSRNITWSLLGMPVDEYRKKFFIENNQEVEVKVNCKTLQDLAGEFLEKYSDPSKYITNRFYLDLAFKHLHDIIRKTVLYWGAHKPSSVFMVPLYGTPPEVILNTITTILVEFLNNNDRYYIPSTIAKNTQAITGGGTSQMFDIYERTYAIQMVDKKLLLLIDSIIDPTLKKKSTESTNQEDEEKLCQSIEYEDEYGEKKSLLIRYTDRFNEQRYIQLAKALNGETFRVSSSNNTVRPPSPNHKCRFNDCIITFNWKESWADRVRAIPSQIYNECEIYDFLTRLPVYADVSRSIIFLNCTIYNDRDKQYTKPVSSFITHIPNDNSAIITCIKSYISIPVFSSEDRMIYVFMNTESKLVYNAGCFFGEEEEFISEINEKYAHDEIVKSNYLSVISHAKTLMRNAVPVTADYIDRCQFGI